MPLRIVCSEGKEGVCVSKGMTGARVSNYRV